MRTAPVHILQSPNRKVHLQFSGKNPCLCTGIAHFPSQVQKFQNWRCAHRRFLAIFDLYSMSSCTRLLISTVHDVGVAKERFSWSLATPTLCCRPIPMRRVGSRDQDSAPVPAFVEVTTRLFLIDPVNSEHLTYLTWHCLPIFCCPAISHVRTFLFPLHQPHVFTCSLLCTLENFTFST